MKRSEFLKLSCTGCMLGAAGVFSITNLLSCAPGAKLATVHATVTNHQLVIPLDQLKETLTIVRGKGMDFEVAVHKNDLGVYQALLMRCTHFSNPLVISGNGFRCDVHGSEFDKNGRVTKGPAGKSLTALSCIADNNSLTIHV